MMGELFGFLSQNKEGFLVAFLSIAAIIFFIQWMCWIFEAGRFGREVRQTPPGSPNRSPIRYVIADLFTKLVNDFRHLLALIIVVMFAGVLIFALRVDKDSVDTMAKALQAVTGTLSGIIGVIIGYYFGESAARRDAANPSPAPSPVAVQAPGTPDGQPTQQRANETIVAAPQPPT